MVFDSNSTNNEKASELAQPGELSKDLLKSAKQMGFSDLQIAQLRNQSETEIRKVRHQLGLRPVFKTGFPIAKIATKLAIGYTLDEITNDITKG